jgi:hypothetical protein
MALRFLARDWRGGFTDGNSNQLRSDYTDARKEARRRFGRSVRRTLQDATLTWPGRLQRQLSRRFRPRELARRVRRHSHLSFGQRGTNRGTAR